MKLKLFLAMAVLAILQQNLLAQAGSPDADFDGDGHVTTAILSGDSDANAVVVQADGKIVVVGSTTTGTAGSSYDYGVVRYRPDGSLDNTFSLNGEANFGIANADGDYAKAVAILSNGKILVAGNSDTGAGETAFSALLLNPSGTSFDVSFGNNGKLLLEGVDFWMEAMVLQSDGKIVAAGHASNSQNDDFALLRLHPDGSLDNTFGGDGKVLIPIVTGQTDRAIAVALQPDGKIVVAGGSFLTGSAADIAVARLNPGGSLDNTFSFDGKLTTAVGEESAGYSVLIQPDGKIVVGGSGGASGNSDMALVRYNSDGTLDASFSTDGKLLISHAGFDYGFGLARQPDGKLIVAGGTGFDNRMIAARVRTNGLLDSSFGDGGLASVEFSGEERAIANDVTLSPSNRIVLAGFAVTNQEFKIGVAQLLTGLSVGIADLSETGATLFYPNPIESQAAFEYELSAAGPVYLTLCDVQGRLLHTFLSKENRPSGKNTETLTLPIGMAAGAYLLQLQTESGKAAIKIVLK
ncbi:MAG: T9SS type A sorting domain-containing protein [Saprospiraceae bacterium]